MDRERLALSGTSKFAPFNYQLNASYYNYLHFAYKKTEAS